MNLKMDFKQGDIIEYCGEQFIVLENRGYSGTVQEYYNGNLGDIVNRFYWEYDGEICKLIQSKQ